MNNLENIFNELKTELDFYCLNEDKIVKCNKIIEENNKTFLNLNAISEFCENDNGIMRFSPSRFYEAEKYVSNWHNINNEYLDKLKALQRKFFFFKKRKNKKFKEVELEASCAFQKYEKLKLLIPMKKQFESDWYVKGAFVDKNVSLKREIEKIKQKKAEQLVVKAIKRDKSLLKIGEQVCVNKDLQIFYDILNEKQKIERKVEKEKIK